MELNFIGDISMGAATYVANGKIVTTEDGIAVTTACGTAIAELIAASLNLGAAVMASDEAEDEMAAIDAFRAALATQVQS